MRNMKYVNGEKLFLNLYDTKTMPNIKSLNTTTHKKSGIYLPGLDQRRLPPHESPMS